MLQQNRQYLKQTKKNSTCFFKSKTLHGIFNNLVKSDKNKYAPFTENIETTETKNCETKNYFSAPFQTFKIPHSTIG